MKNISTCYIYKITNKITNHSYVGSRINNNPYEDDYMGSSKYLNEDMKIYDVINFHKEIIEVLHDCTKEKLLDRETYFILYYNTLNPNGYNKHLPNKYFSWHRAGIPLSETAKAKISKGLISAYSEGRKIVPDYSGENHPLYGKTHSDEAKIKCGNSMRGKTHTKETKELISAANTGVKKTIEHAKNISEGRKGMHFSEDHKRHISEGKKGKTFSFTPEGKISHRLALDKINNKKIACPMCGKLFNSGNYARHRKLTCIESSS